MFEHNATTLPAETLGDDILKGAEQIALFIGESERRTRYLIDRGYVPAGQIGRIWVASKKTLREHYSRVTGQV
jgi:hypothetical protein